MKTLVLIQAALLLLCQGHVMAQAMIVSDPEALIAINNVDARLTQILQEAEKQNQKLEEQLKLIGDPSAVTMGMINTIKDDIMKAAQDAKTSSNRLTRLRSTTGAEIFGQDNSYGIMDVVESTYTTKEGTTEDRDPERYKLQAALMKELNAYEADSVANEERKAKLLAEYQKVVDDMSGATSLAATMKYKAMLDVIASQIEECSAASIKAKQDYDVVKEKLQVADRIEAQAKAEGRILDDRARRDAARAALDATRAAAAGAVATPRRAMGWGPPAAADPDPAGGTAAP